MATDFLDKVRGEIDARIKALRPAVEEHAQLTEVASAFGVSSGTSLSAGPRKRHGRPPGKRNTSSSVASPASATGTSNGTSAKAPKAPKASAAKRPKGAKRAPRGANRAAILKALNDGEGTPTELSTRSGISGPLVHSQLPILIKEGLVAKRKTESGKSVYALSGDGTSSS
jgi:predicted transcriptional regulator